MGNGESLAQGAGQEAKLFTRGYLGKCPREGNPRAGAMSQPSKMKREREMSTKAVDLAGCYLQAYLILWHCSDVHFHKLKVRPSTGKKTATHRRIRGWLAFLSDEVF